jgi:peptide/nickel transport system substrate-binding protein
MRRFIATVLVAAAGLLPAACHQQPQGSMRAIVIGDEPKLRDPTLGPLPPADAVLLENVAQGLVQFDANGNIVAGLAERWNVSDDGLSYLFRLASANWPDGRKITAEQVARLLKREIGPRSKNELKDSLGAIEDIVAMTDRVIEIRLTAPRPNLLSLLAQPQAAILRDGQGTGPFTMTAAPEGAALRLTREIVPPDDETTIREQVLLSGAPAAEAIRGFAAGQSDLVLGGTFDDLPLANRASLPRGSLRFDPASGLLGLVPVSSGGPLDKPEVRHLLSEAIDRDSWIAALDVPGLAPRATLLEPGLDGIPPPVVPAWTATPYADRLPSLQARAKRLLPREPRPAIRVALPQGPGSALLLQLLSRDWGALGFTVERAQGPAAADFVLVDQVAPSSSPAWFVRRFNCTAARVCDAQADQLMDAARQSQIPAQRYALLLQAAARIDDAQLFLPLAAPVRWSLVSRRIQSFAGNRFARHTLTGLEQNDSGGD